LRTAVGTQDHETVFEARLDGDHFSTHEHSVAERPALGPNEANPACIRYRIDDPSVTQQPWMCSICRRVTTASGCQRFFIRSSWFSFRFRVIVA
jgi:hypothetical protein